MIPAFYVALQHNAFSFAIAFSKCPPISVQLPHEGSGGAGTEL